MKRGAQILVSMSQRMGQIVLAESGMLTYISGWLIISDCQVCCLTENKAGTTLVC